MLEMLYESAIAPELSESAAEVLQALRKEFEGYPIDSLGECRPLLIKDSSCQLFTFQGTKVNRSLSFLFKAVGAEVQYTEHNSSFVFPGGMNDVKSFIEKAEEVLENVEFYVENEVIARPAIMDFSKWSIHLPVKYKCQLLHERYFDFAGAEVFLKSVNPVAYTDI
jgi:ATP-dependent Lhr-like helicase